MKNIKYLILVTTLLTGCYKKEVRETIKRTKYIDIETEVFVRKINKAKKIPEDLSIVTIDGCEYITIKYWASGDPTVSITHKGNCKYCKYK